MSIIAGLRSSALHKAENLVKVLLEPNPDLGQVELDTNNLLISIKRLVNWALDEEEDISTCDIWDVNEDENEKRYWDDENEDSDEDDSDEDEDVNRLLGGYLSL